jgi:hypothetical protein
MECNKKVYEILPELTYKQNIQFALSCLDRVKHLCPLFLNSNQYGIEYLIKEIMPRDAIELLINTTIQDLRDPINIKKETITNKVELLESLLLDSEEENSTESAIFFQIIITMINTLEYIRDKDINSIGLCSDDIVELINQAKSNEYYINNPNASDEEISEYADLLIDKDVEIQIEIIKKIKNAEDTTEIDKYIENNKIEYNSNLLI